MEWPLAEIVPNFIHGVVHAGYGVHNSRGSSHLAAERAGAIFIS